MKAFITLIFLSASVMAFANEKSISPELSAVLLSRDFSVVTQDLAKRGANLQLGRYSYDSGYLYIEVSNERGILGYLVAALDHSLRVESVYFKPQGGPPPAGGIGIPPRPRWNSCGARVSWRSVTGRGSASSMI